MLYDGPMPQRRTPGAYARDPTTVPLEMIAELAVAPPGRLLHLARLLRKYYRRKFWRLSQSYKNAGLSRAIRLAEKALGVDFAGRARGPSGEWVLFGAVDGCRIPAIIVSRPRIARFEDFKVPISVEVKVPELVDLELLRRVSGGDEQKERG